MAQIHEGIIANYLNEFQRRAVEGVLQGGTLPHHMPNMLHPSTDKTPMLLSGKAPATKEFPGYVHFPGSSKRMNAPRSG